MNDVNWKVFAISGEIKKDEMRVFIAKESDCHFFYANELGMGFQKLNPFPMGIFR